MNENYHKSTLLMTKVKSNSQK